MPTNKHNLLLNRTFQYLGIILVMAAMGGGYWYWKNAQAGLNINTSQEGALSNGLVGYWPFDGNDISGTTAYDRSGQGNNGTLTNGPTKTIGKVGQSLAFGGPIAVNLGSDASLDNLGPVTFSAWIYPRSLGGGSLGKIITKDTNGSSGHIQFFVGGVGTSGTGCTSPMNVFYFQKQGTSTLGKCTTDNAISFNRWQHVVVTWDGSVSASNVHIYKDGIELGYNSGASNGSGLNSDDTLNYYVGNRGDGSRGFDGYIDEPRIYNRVLSPSEIQSLYELGNPDKMNSADSQGDTLEKGLVGYWKLDDASGTSAADASGNGNTGTLTNGPTWTAGQIGGAVDFDGTDDYITASQTSTGLTQLTVSVWANPDQTLANQNGIFKWASAYNDGTPFILIAREAGTTNAQFYVDGNYRLNYPISNGSWSLISLTLDINNLWRFYVNGIYAGSFQDDGSHLNQGESGLFFGRTTLGGFDGKLDEVRVYNRALSADEVAKLYQTTAPDNPDAGLIGYWPFNGKDISGTTAYDRSGKGNNGTLTNDPTKTIGKIGQALSFDGTNDEVTTTTNYGDSSTLKTISIAVWFKTVTASGKKIIGLEQVQSGYNNNKDRVIYVGTDGKVYFAVWDGSVRSAISNGTYTDGNWHHAVGVSSGDGTNIKLYVDGVLQQTTSVGTIGTYAGGTSYWRIGGYSNDNFVNSSNGYFPGQIDEPRIYNRALSASEVWDFYQAGAADKVNSADSQSTPLERGLAGYWRFDDASGGSAADSSGNGMTGTLTNGPTWTTGQVDGAVDLDGTNDYVSIADNAALDIGTGDFTYGFWLNPDDTTQGVFFSDGSYSDGIMFYRWTDTHNYVWLGNTYFSSTNWVPTASTWQHITLRRKSGTVTMYADGVQKFSGTLSNSINSSLGMRIGYGFAGAANVPVNGRIDEFRMYNRALSDEEILQLSRLGRPDNPDTGLVGYWPFNGPDISGTTAYDRSGKSNNGTLTNGPTKTIGKSGQGMSFDGSDDYVDTNQSTAFNFSNTTFTVTGWFKTTQTTSGMLLGKQTALVNGGWIIDVNNQNANKLSATLKDSAGNNAAYVSTVSSVNNGAWHHFAAIMTTDTVTSANNNVVIYLDGATDYGSVNRAGTPYATNANTLKFGRRDTQNYYNGSLDEVRIYNRALSAAEVTALYNAGR